MKEYNLWFKKAENDLLSIKNNLSAKEVPVDTCCFHAQQATEKYLKAYLVSRSKFFPKTHDLKELVKLCGEVNPIFNSLEVSFVDKFSIIPRYPDALDDLTIEDAKQAYDNAIIIKEIYFTTLF